MRPLKLFNRAAKRPDLKSRFAGLKARLGRVARKPVETDPQRRTMLGASLAAVLPLPALAGAGHSDAALLAIGCRLDEATRAYLAIRPHHLDLQAQEQAAIDRTYAVHGTLDSEVGLNFCLAIIAPFRAELDRCNAAREEVDRRPDGWRQFERRRSMRLRARRMRDVGA